jgi:hypothetical protein
MLDGDAVKCWPAEGWLRTSLACARSVDGASTRKSATPIRRSSPEERNGVFFLKILCFFVDMARWKL